MSKIKWLVPTIYIVFLMLPIYWLINMSFKTTTEIINTYSLWPQKFTTENYVKIFTDSTWYMGYVNSITYTVFNTIISVAAALPAADWFIALSLVYVSSGHRLSYVNLVQLYVQSVTGVL